MKAKKATTSRGGRMMKKASSKKNNKIVKYKGSGIGSVVGKIGSTVAKYTPKVIGAVKKMISGGKQAHRTYKKAKPLIDEGVKIGKEGVEIAKKVNEKRKTIKNPKNVKEALNAGLSIASTGLNEGLKRSKDIEKSIKKISHGAPSIRQELGNVFYTKNNANTPSSPNLINDNIALD